MKKLKWISAGLTLSAAVILAVSCNTDELKPDGDKNEELQKPVAESKLTLQEHQANIDALGTTLVSNFKAEDYKPLIETIHKLILYIETGFDQSGKRMSVAPVKDVAGTMINTLKGKNPSDLTATTTAVAEMIVSVENILGSKGCEFVYNPQTRSWDVTPLVDKREIKMSWDNSSLLLTYSEDFTKYRYEEFEDGRKGEVINIEVPDHIAMDLKIEEQTMLSLDLKPGISIDGLTIAPKLSVSIVDLGLISTAIANPDFISSEFSVSKGGVEFMSAYYKLTVPGMTSPENWIVRDMWDDETETDPEEALENKVKSGEFYINILNMQIRGEGNLRKCIDELDALDNNESLTEEEEALQEADIINRFINIELIYTDDYTRIATVIMQPVSEPGGDYTLEPVLLFGDGSTMPFGTFFKNLESELLIVLGQFAAIFENLDDIID